MPSHKLVLTLEFDFEPGAAPFPSGTIEHHDRQIQNAIVPLLAAESRFWQAQVSTKNLRIRTKCHREKNPMEDRDQVPDENREARIEFLQRGSKS